MVRSPRHRDRASLPIDGCAPAAATLNNISADQRTKNPDSCQGPSKEACYRPSIQASSVSHINPGVVASPALGSGSGYRVPDFEQRRRRLHRPNRRGSRHSVRSARIRPGSAISDLRACHNDLASNLAQSRGTRTFDGQHLFPRHSASTKSGRLCACLQRSMRREAHWQNGIRVGAGMLIEDG